MVSEEPARLHMDEIYWISFYDWFFPTFYLDIRVSLELKFCYTQLPVML